MQMKMRNRITGIVTYVHDQAKSTVQTLAAGHFINSLEQLRKQWSVLIRDLRNILDVLRRHHQHVSRGLWADIPKGNSMRRTGNFDCRDFSGHNLAEQAIFHPFNAITSIRYKSVPSGSVNNESLNRAMQEWTSEARMEQARAARQTRHWQQHLAGEEARFSGLLLDLHERKCAIRIDTEGGRCLAGPIDEIGSDFIAIKNRSEMPAYIRLHVITAVEVDGTPQNTGPPSIRTLEAFRSLDTVISELADRRALIRFATKNSSELRSAFITAAGIDVVTLELAGSPVRTLFVATEQLSEVSLAA